MQIFFLFEVTRVASCTFLQLAWIFFNKEQTMDRTNIKKKYVFYQFILLIEPLFPIAIGSYIQKHQNVILLNETKYYNVVLYPIFINQLFGLPNLH